MGRFFNISAIILLITIFISASAVAADPKIDLSKGQTLYVPAYSHIYFGRSRERPYQLTITLSIRNIDIENSITVTQVNYYASKGELVKNYAEKPITVKGFESIRYIIPAGDVSGGSGANFLVKWVSDKPVNPPIVESIMIGTQGQHGISFSSRGREIIAKPAP